MKCLLFSADNLWSRYLFSKLRIQYNPSEVDWIFCNTEEDYSMITEDVSWAFFFHWGHIVPKSIHSGNNCVTVHTSNLPHNRGGSPIQNQIVKNVKFSRVNLIKMSDVVDGGPVYCSKPITLSGDLTDIWITIADGSYELINKCIKENLIPKEQQEFIAPEKRRRDNQLPIESSTDVFELYDFIRMLDGEGYENSHLNISDFKISFSRAKIMTDNRLMADVIIEKKV